MSQFPYSLMLHNNVLVSTDVVREFTDIASEYQDTWRAMGGCCEGQFTIRNRPLPELEEWYNYFLGFRVVRSVGGVAQWEGLITQMRLTSGGQTYVRDLNKMVNWAKVLYTSTDGSTNNETAWSNDTDSTDQFGERDEIYTLDGAESAMAEAYRDTKLETYAWPRSFGAGGELYGDAAGTPPQLVVSLSGYVFTLNWRFVTSNSTTLTNLSSFLSTLVGESEFVTAGAITTNTTQVPQRFLSPTRIWDGIERLTNIGDASGNRYSVQVMPGRTLNYQQAATTVYYQIREGRLHFLDGSLVMPSEVRSDRIARRYDAPSGFQNAGEFADPRNTYIEEVDFIAPGLVRIKSEDWDVADLLDAQLALARDIQQGGGES